LDTAFVKMPGDKRFTIKNKKGDGVPMKKKAFGIFYVIIVIFLLIFAVLYLSLASINLKQQTETRIQKLGLEFAEPDSYTWEPQLKGELRSVKISGKIQGRGVVRTYLDNLLILDSSKIKSRILLTGSIVQDLENTSQELSEDPNPEQDENTSQEQIKTGKEENSTSDENKTIPIREFDGVCEETCNLTGLNDSSYNITVEVEDAKLNLDEIEYKILTQEKNNENLSLIGENEENLTETNISEIQETKEAKIETIQYRAVVGKPVKWKKIITPGEEGNLTIKIPKEAENVIAKKIDSGVESLASASITGQSVAGFDKDSFIGITLIFFKKIFSRFFASITGNAIVESQDLEVEIDKQEAEYEIEYETPAPQAFEYKEDEKEKRIIISGPENVHYQEVLAFSELENEVSAERIHLYYLTKTTKEEIAVDKYDTNDNGLVDYIEWVVPSLSNKTYSLEIEITKAEHLDENRILIRSIYEQVKKNDGVWSEPINNNEYVRVRFEKNLTKENDIKIYARSSSGSKIEVYAKDSSELIATFDEFSGEGIYKVFLSNLEDGESYDFFDLKIIGGSVEFDYIVDPSYSCEGTATACSGLGSPDCGDTVNDPQYGCYWSVGTSSCKGTATGCPSLGESGNCGNQLGCDWYKVSCDGAYIRCPASASVGVPFNVTYGATSQSNPSSSYDKTSLRVYKDTSELECDEFTSGGEGASTGDKSLNVTEATTGTKTYTIYCKADSSSQCGATTSDSQASCNVNIAGSSETNLTLKQGWNTFALVFGSSTSGDKNITLNNTWNLIGFSASSPLNITKANFTNSTGTRLTWANAVTQSKFQAYMMYQEGGVSKYVADPDLSMDDYRLKNATGYYIKVNQKGILTLPGAGGSTSGLTFNFTSLRFNNGTEEVNWTDARDKNWTFAATKVIYLWNETFAPSPDYKTVCGTVACDQTTLAAWRGYQIWSNKNNIVMIRRG
jgi:hypothetical protein